MHYPDTLLHIDGAWMAGSAHRNRDVVDPGTGRRIGSVAAAAGADIDAAIASAGRGLSSWSALSAFDIDAAAQMLAVHKYHNAGQVCIAPRRILFAEEAKAAFVPLFLEIADAVRVGNGQDETATMGPLANERRLHAAERLVQDAVSKGAKLLRGVRRIGNAGNFFEPTVLQDVPLDAQIMHEEPFGPVAVINGFATIDAAITEAEPPGLWACRLCLHALAENGRALFRGDRDRNALDQPLRARIRKCRSTA